MLAMWAEMNVVVADEFRDGNVPARLRPLPVTRRALAALPEGVKEFYFRGHSVCDEEGLLSWLRNDQREGGPSGFIGFAVRAHMDKVLHEAITQTPESCWQPYSEESAAIKECADIDYVAEETPANRYRKPFRYVAIPQEATGAVCRRQYGEALRGDFESMGLDPEETVGLAPRKGGHD
jgi:hypothetical protein